MTRSQKQIQSQLHLERQILSAQLHSRQYQAMSGSVNPVDIQMQDKLEVRLASIKRAILRLEKGKYGICQSCGGEIDTARLKALPYAEQCIDCQRKLERKVFQWYAAYA